MDVEQATALLAAYDDAIERAKAATSRPGDPRAMERMVRIEVTLADRAALWDAVDATHSSGTEQALVFGAPQVERYAGIPIEVHETLSEPAVIASNGWRLRFPVKLMERA